MRVSFQIGRGCGLALAWRGLLAVTMVWASMARAGAQTYPDAPRQPVTDTFHGVSVSEDYRWLEDLAAPPVKDWVARQNALTRSVVDALPQRAAIAAELTELIGKAPVRRSGLKFAAGRLFALKRAPSTNQPTLVMLTNPSDPASERVVVDPNALNPKGTTAIDWYVPSLDGKTVAVSLSDEGSEDGSLHFFDAATGTRLPDQVPRVSAATGGGSVAWAAGNRGVYYTRYPQGSERSQEDVNFYQQVWFHQLGTPAAQDRYVIGRAFPRIAEIALSSTPDGRYILAKVSNGDGGEHAFHLRAADGRWRELAGLADGVNEVALGRDGRWYALVLKGSPRGRIISGALARPTLAGARLVRPEGTQVIDGLLPTRSRLYVQTQAGGPTELHSYTLDGRPLGRLGADDIATVSIGTALAGDGLLFGSQSFVKPFVWYRFSPTAREPMPAPVPVPLSEPPKAIQLDDMVVTREMVTSKDGTPVPINIVHRRGTPLDGSSPALLTGYGAYGASMQPWFSPRNAFWLQHGGTFVLANLRGGGEFGEAWHLAGNLTRKQNVFDDFIAAAEHLVAKGYTSARRLVIEGGSNGGLLMGAAMVQRPELFRAVVSHVGIYDMLRVELSPNGAFNITEFGSVKDAAQFNALYAYSPYHHVVDGTAYPAVMLLAGMNDGRVSPWQSLKMAARLQAAAAPGRPVLLRTADDAGHGQGLATSSLIEKDADVFAFVFEQLGMK